MDINSLELKVGKGCLQACLQSLCFFQKGPLVILCGVTKKDPIND